MAWLQSHSYYRAWPSIHAYASGHTHVDLSCAQGPPTQDSAGVFQHRHVMDLPESLGGPIFKQGSHQPRSPTAKSGSRSKTKAASPAPGEGPPHVPSANQAGDNANGSASPGNNLSPNKPPLAQQGSPANSKRPQAVPKLFNPEKPPNPKDSETPGITRMVFKVVAPEAKPKNGEDAANANNDSVNGGANKAGAHDGGVNAHHRRLVEQRALRPLLSSTLSQPGNAAQQSNMYNKDNNGGGISKPNSPTPGPKPRNNSHSENTNNNHEPNMSAQAQGRVSEIRNLFNEIGRTNSSDSSGKMTPRTYNGGLVPNKLSPNGQTDGMGRRNSKSSPEKTAGKAEDSDHSHSDGRNLAGSTSNLAPGMCGGGVVNEILCVWRMLAYLLRGRAVSCCCVNPRKLRDHYSMTNGPAMSVKSCSLRHVVSANICMYACAVQSCTSAVRCEK